jgi:hypothetical protein
MLQLVSLTSIAATGSRVAAFGIDDTPDNILVVSHGKFFVFAGAGIPRASDLVIVDQPREALQIPGLVDRSAVHSA